MNLLMQYVLKTGSLRFPSPYEYSIMPDAALQYSLVKIGQRKFSFIMRNTLRKNSLLKNSFILTIFFSIYSVLTSTLVLIYLAD